MGNGDLAALHNNNKTAVLLEGGTPTPLTPAVQHSCRSRFSRKGIVVGVDICRDGIRLVKVSGSTSLKCDIIACKSVPIPDDLLQKSGGPEHVLKDALSDFCGKSGNCKIWTASHSTAVTVRHIQIPKVAPSQIDGAVQWAIKKDTSLNVSQSIIDLRVQGEVIDKGIPKLAVSVYTAPKEEIESLRRLFAGIGFPLTGITPSFCAFDNLLQAGFISEAAEGTVILDIGQEDSCISIHFGSNSVFTRSIKFGVNSLLESLREESQTEIDLEQARQLLCTLDSGKPQASPDTPGTPAENQDVLQMVLPALRRFVRNIERTLEHYSRSINAAGLQHFYMAGDIVLYKSLVGYLQNQLNIEVKVLNPFASTRFKLNSAVIAEAREGEIFADAAAVAMSQCFETPNFLFTHQAKSKQASISRLNRKIGLVFVLALLLCFAFLLWQKHKISRKLVVKNRLEQQLAEIQPKVEMPLIQLMVAQAKLKQKSNESSSKEYLGLALLNELSAITSPAIRLTKITLALGDLAKPVDPNKNESPQKSENKTKAELAGKSKKATLEGVVIGGAQALEGLLAEYMLTLAKSPFLTKPILEKSEFQRSQDPNLLYFTIKLAIVSH